MQPSTHTDSDRVPSGHKQQALNVCSRFHVTVTVNFQQPTSSGESSVYRPLLVPDTVEVFTFILPPEGCSSVTSVYILDRAIGVRSPAQVTDFSQTSSGAHPASCTMGTRGSFPGVNRGRGVTLTTHPHLVSGSRMWSYTSSSPCRLHGGS
jgi:hypothetical protein